MYLTLDLFNAFLQNAEQKRCQKSVRAMDAQSDDLCGASSIIIVSPHLGPVLFRVNL